MMVSPGPRYLRTTSLDSPEMAEAQRRFRENFARNRAKFESFEQEESRRSTWTLSAIPPRPPVRRASSLRVASEIMLKNKNNVGGQHNLQITQTDLREKKVTYTTSIEIQIGPDGGDAARRRRSEGNSGRFTSFTKEEPVTLVDEERHEEKSDGRQFFTSTVTRNVALVYDVAKPEDDYHQQQKQTRESISSSSKSSTISVTENKLPRTVPIVTNFRKFKAPE